MLETKNKTIMKRLNRVSVWVLWLAVIAVFPAIALADESWTSNVGDISWEDSLNNTAVFLYATPNSDSAETRLFIKDLVPDATGTRRTYTGYWTDNSSMELDSDRDPCEASLTDLKGLVTQRWGRLSITFQKSSKGSWDFKAKVGYCFDEPSQTITAKS